MNFFLVVVVQNCQLHRSNFYPLFDKSACSKAVNDRRKEWWTRWKCIKHNDLSFWPLSIIQSWSKTITFLGNYNHNYKSCLLCLRVFGPRALACRNRGTDTHWEIKWVAWIYFRCKVQQSCCYLLFGGTDKKRRCIWYFKLPINTLCHHWWTS